jgi:hypothetical protein
MRSPARRDESPRSNCRHRKFAGVTIAVGVAVAVAVTIAVGVAVAVGVGVADAVADPDVDGLAVGVADVLGADVVGARVAGEVTCPEFAPVVWGVQPVTVMPPAASRPTSDAMASGQASRRRLEAGAGPADVTVLVLLPMSGHSTSVEVTGPDSRPAPGPVRPG